MMWRQRCRPFLLIVLLYWGCAGSGGPTAYYTLQAAPGADLRGKDPQTANLVIGLGPVTLPRHLDRDAIVTRVSPNQLKVNDRHRWAGSLHTDVVRVLAARLEDLAQVKEVVVYPWPTRVEPDLRFRMEILAFEGRPGQQVTLKAAWSLAQGASSQPAVRRTTLVRQEVKGTTIEAMVAAMGSALDQLSNEMAEAISKAYP